MHSHFQNTYCRQIKGHVEQMGLNLASCGDDMLQYRRCLAASFFLNAAVKQPEGTYRYLIQLGDTGPSEWLAVYSLCTKFKFHLLIF